ncbi:Gfo/Idh/MocA family protein [Neolewinella antarctica]|uniref:Dehydrogenase n=1 Tax=Neolewinella antarctica TaxID=442734 RepID=A0ABX0XCA0_9BACT|nr:Gfo/Idh/MocA family oxidoreductase [Neolewinella antarctica]NJC26463.1 putative dehydrogenase [Neolewinella antarctica]
MSTDYRLISYRLHSYLRPSKKATFIDTLPKVKFLVVGLGHIGRRHAALIVAHPGARLAGIVDPLAKDELRWDDNLPADTLYFTDLKFALQQTDRFDVACICTPNGLHADQTIAALEAGLDVVIEKPLATDSASAERIKVTAEKVGCRVFGVMQNRYSPASAWLKACLVEKRLGRVLQVHLDCFWNRDHRYYTIAPPPADPAPAPVPSALLPDQNLPHPWHGNERLDGGVLYTQFAHFIDLLCWGFGEPTIHHARFANQNHRDFHAFPDSGSVQFSLPNEVMGSLNFSTAVWDQNFESTLTVIATEGTIKLGGQYMNEVRYCHAKNIAFPDLPASAPGNDYGGYTGSAANHHFVIDNVVDVRNDRAEIATPVEEGVMVVRVIEAIYKSGSE